VLFVHLANRIVLTSPAIDVRKGGVYYVVGIGSMSCLKHTIPFYHMPHMETTPAVGLNAFPLLWSPVFIKLLLNQDLPRDDTPRWHHAFEVH